MSEENKSPLPAHSDACLKAGIGAILVSIFSVYLLDTLTMLPSLRAYGRYVQQRLLLTAAINEIDAHPCWTSATAEQRRTLDQTPLATVDITCDREQRATGTLLPKKDDLGGELGTELLRDANVPRKVQIGAGSTALADAIGIFKLTFNCDELVAATRLSPEIEASISAWQHRRVNLLTESEITRNERVSRWDLLVCSDEHRNGGAIAGRNVDKILRVLSLANLRRVAATEPVTASDFQDVAKKFETVAVPGVGLTVNPSWATYLVEGVVALLLTWLLLNLREATLSPKYPGDGTIFRTFSRTRGARSLFLGLLVIPPIAMALIAWRTTTDQPLNMLGAGCTLVAATRIARTFASSVAADAKT